MADEVVAAYATKLFIRSEAEIRRPVVLLTGERTNVFGVLEKHFKETALPPSERFWRTVRTQWTPQLDTWRPRVNGTQLKVRGEGGRGGGRVPPRGAACGTADGARPPSLPLTAVADSALPCSKVAVLHPQHAI